MNQPVPSACVDNETRAKELLAESGHTPMSERPSFISGEKAERFNFLREAHAMKLRLPTRDVAFLFSLINEAQMVEERLSGKCDQLALVLVKNGLDRLNLAGRGQPYQGPAF